MLKCITHHDLWKEANYSPCKRVEGTTTNPSIMLGRRPYHFSPFFSFFHSSPSSLKTYFFMKSRLHSWWTLNWAGLAWHCWGHDINVASMRRIFIKQMMMGLYQRASFLLQLWSGCVLVLSFLPSSFLLLLSSSNLRWFGAVNRILWYEWQHSCTQAKSSKSSSSNNNWSSWVKIWVKMCSPLL